MFPFSCFLFVFVVVALLSLKLPSLQKMLAEGVVGGVEGGGGSDGGGAGGAIGCGVGGAVAGGLV